MSKGTPVKATYMSVSESFVYAQLSVRGKKTDQIGTPLTVEIRREFDRWLAKHDAEMVARTLNAVSVYLYQADLIDAVSSGRVSLIFNELTDDEWLDWLEDARLLIKKGN